MQLWSRLVSGTSRCLVNWRGANHQTVAPHQDQRWSKTQYGLHDIARNDSRNEYFAGGQSEEGGGSATVLVWPDEEDGENKTDAAAEPEEPVEKFTGSGRKL